MQPARKPVESDDGTYEGSVLGAFDRLAEQDLAAEIAKDGTTFLEQRLAVIDYSTIPHQAAEAAMIRAELDRRKAARTA